MKIVESKVEYLPQGEGLDEMYKHIERCGRVCYKSEDKITEGSAKKFVDNIIKNKHLGVIEHGTVYLQVPREAVHKGEFGFDCYDSHSVIIAMPDFAITTNLRVIQENCEEDTLKYICEPTKYHERRYTFKFICSRGIADELRTHRPFSYCMESTRYVNYNKQEDMEFVSTSGAALNTGRYEWNNGFIVGDGYIEDTQDPSAERILLRHWMESEHSYNTMIALGMKPQDARAVLPLSIKTTLVMTGFASDWREFLDKRLFEKTGKVHPDMKILMKKLQKVAEDAGIWEDIISHHSKY